MVSSGDNGRCFSELKNYPDEHDSRLGESAEKTRVTIKTPTVAKKAQNSCFLI